MMKNKKVPLGLDDYQKVIDGNYCFLDKTLFIKELLENGTEVNLFTRPRRFGKSLNISMIRYFFEKPVNNVSNKYLFKGMNISTETKLCAEHQEQYPVIQLSLKSGKQPQ